MLTHAHIGNAKAIRFCHPNSLPDLQKGTPEHCVDWSAERGGAKLNKAHHCDG